MITNFCYFNFDKINVQASPMKMQYSTDWQQYLTQDVVDEMVSKNLLVCVNFGSQNDDGEKMAFFFTECHSSIL